MRAYVEWFGPGVVRLIGAENAVGAAGVRILKTKVADVVGIQVGVRCRRRRRMAAVGRTAASDASDASDAADAVLGAVADARVVSPTVLDTRCVVLGEVMRFVDGTAIVGQVGNVRSTRQKK